jgi:hypothetical protein
VSLSKGFCSLSPNDAGRFNRQLFVLTTAFFKNLMPKTQRNQIVKLQPKYCWAALSIP